MGENAVFSVEGTAGYRSVIIKQTGRKCAALNFMRFSGIAIRPTICYGIMENTIFNDTALIEDAAIYGTQIFALLVNRVSVEEIIVAAFQIYVVGVAV